MLPAAVPGSIIRKKIHLLIFLNSLLLITLRYHMSRNYIHTSHKKLRIHYAVKQLSHLFHHYPGLNEGELSKLRAALVCEKALAPCARKIQLGSYILLGHGEKLNHGEERDSLLCDVIEAVIGAIYTDSGLEEANRFIFRFILGEESLTHLDFIDYKTKFQELVQANTSEPIVYEIVGTSGPDHSKQFEVEARVGDRTLGRGVGTSRKNAEQIAAKEAINTLSKGWT